MSPRRHWTDSEDSAIRSLVFLHGTKSWKLIASLLQTECQVFGRTGKQCRERWHNHLAPEVDKKPWSVEEEKRLFEGKLGMGNRWASISKLLPGRSNNDIKNHYYSTMRKFCRKQLSSVTSKETLELREEELIPGIIASIGKWEKEGKRTQRKKAEKKSGEEDRERGSFWERLDTAESTSTLDCCDSNDWQRILSLEVPTQSDFHDSLSRFLG